ncbi:MAG: 4Fe-4S single cluster domain-containing protein [Pyrinomonadaceae bacterium]
MASEIVFTLEPDVGRVTVEASRLSKAAANELVRDLGTSLSVNCARPALEQKLTGPVSQRADTLRTDAPSIYLYRLYHYSTVDGPGRRSVVQVSGCSIRCPGCYVPETHERSSGVLTSICSIVEEIEAKQADHDGVTILGGEPFDQPGALADLVRRLKRHNLHVAVYSGYTFQNLFERSDPRTTSVLSQADLLIDGPYIRELAENAGEYRGSHNQKLILRQP